MNLRKVSDATTDPWGDTRFCRPEVLFLDSLRLWSQNPANLEHIRRMMMRELGPAPAERATKGLKFFGHVVGLHARRTLQLMHPGIVGATTDERAMLAMIGAVLHGRRSQAHAIANWLLPPDCHGTVLALSGELGRAFRAGGLEIAPPRAAYALEEVTVELRAVG